MFKSAALLALTILTSATAAQAGRFDTELACWRQMDLSEATAFQGFAAYHTRRDGTEGVWAVTSDRAVFFAVAAPEVLRMIVPGQAPQYMVVSVDGRGRVNVGPYREPTPAERGDCRRRPETCRRLPDLSTATDVVLAAQPEAPLGEAFSVLHEKLAADIIAARLDFEFVVDAYRGIAGERAPVSPWIMEPARMLLQDAETACHPVIAPQVHQALRAYRRSVSRF